MKQLNIPRSNYQTPSVIYFDKNLERLKTLALDNTIIISNSTIMDLYPDIANAYPTILIGDGEAHKTFQTVEQIHRQLLALGVDRGGQIVGFGGGIITDVTGFAASTFMRGIDFGFVATTLLAQVDASVGGKNGVNLDGYKNIIGTFNQPSWVICPANVLKTLPERQLLAGYAEAIKCGLIASKKLFEAFEGPIETQFIVEKSVAIKASIVSQDERESGVRKLLNLGHTFAHSIEKCSSGAYLHGEAVAIGLVMAAKASAQLKMLSPTTVLRIEKTIANIGLPTECPEIPKEQLVAAMYSDKKKLKQNIDFILLEDIGQAVIKSIPLHEIPTLL